MFKFININVIIRNERENVEKTYPCVLMKTIVKKIEYKSIRLYLKKYSLMNIFNYLRIKQVEKVSEYEI